MTVISGPKIGVALGGGAARGLTHIPFMEALDCPDASQWTPRRTTSVTALQALAMWNDKFVVRQSQHLADRIVQSASGSRDNEIRVAFRLVFGRDPGEPEARSLRRYVDQHGWANACRVLLNSNEFLFVD